MTVNTDILGLYSPDNAFKNVNKYSGNLTFATSVTANSTLTPTSVVALTDTPVFTAFFCNFLEFEDALNSVGSAQWYNTGAPSYQEAPNIALLITAPSPHVNEWSSCTVYPVISGNTVTITGYFQNPYAVNLTLQALTVPWVFVEYTLAS